MGDFLRLSPCGGLSAKFFSLWGEFPSVWRPFATMSINLPYKKMWLPFFKVFHHVGDFLPFFSLCGGGAFFGLAPPPLQKLMQLDLLDPILPYTIKKILARLDKYFGRFLHFCVTTLKAFDRKYQREFRRLARDCSQHIIACGSCMCGSVNIVSSNVCISVQSTDTLIPRNHV